MARGSRDFGAGAARSLTAPMLDLGELAVRLGAPISYDRLGSVIAILTGADPVNAFPEQHIGGGRADPFFSYSPFGPYTWRLEAPANLDAAAVQSFFPYIGDAPAGVEVVWKMPSGQLDAFELLVEVSNGTTRTNAGLRWNGTEADWQHKNSSGTFVDTPTQPNDPFQSTWHSLKLVFDPTLQTYVRGLVDGESLELAGIDGQNDASVRRSVRTSVRVQSSGTPNQVAEVAAVIVTVEEETA